MPDESTRTCGDCEGTMLPIVIMDKQHTLPSPHRYAGSLEYRLPDDRLSFWTGKFPSAGTVRAFLCEGCGRIALYGANPASEK